jgi:hypothetical protein
MYKYDWKFKYRNVYFENDKQNVHNIKVRTSLPSHRTFSANTLSTRPFLVDGRPLLPSQLTMCKQWWSTDIHVLVENKVKEPTLK